MLLHGNSEAQMIIVTDQTVKVHNLKNFILTTLKFAPPQIFQYSKFSGFTIVQ